MKKLIYVAMLGIVAAACSNKQEVENLQHKVDSLQTINDMKDQNITLLATTMADVQTNLNSIKEKEKIVSVAVNDETTTKEQIQADIDAIYKLLTDNKNKVANLQAQLNKSSKKNKELESLIAVMQSQIDQQNAEIENLKTMLEEKDIQIAFLNDALIRISSSVDSISVAKAEVDKELAAATDEIQTGYYIIAEKKDLKNKGVVEADGLFKKSVSGDYDNSVFTKVNTTELTTLPLECKKAKILSKHPDSSYAIETDANGMQTLVIKNQHDFWNASKYLVIQK